jgi:hypothetical protein
MPDRSEDLRREAARCLEAAERSTDPNARDELIRLAHTFLELANSAKAKSSRPRRKNRPPQLAASSFWPFASFG